MNSTTELQELQELIAEVDAIILDHKATLIDHPNSLALAANIRSFEKLQRNLVAKLNQANSESAAG
jgi:hypothetical protein